MPEPAAPVLTATLTCPKCGTPTEAAMPTDACVFFWDCPACAAVVRPLPGDCCVFCSYADRPCPPIQSGSSCCW